MFILFSAKFELTASEANVVQSRVVKVADSAFVRLDAGLHSANSVVADFAVVAPVSAGVSPLISSPPEHLKRMSFAAVLSASVPAGLTLNWKLVM
jgi:hypothetical protein